VESLFFDVTKCSVKHVQSNVDDLLEERNEDLLMSAE